MKPDDKPPGSEHLDFDQSFEEIWEDALRIPPPARNPDEPIPDWAQGLRELFDPTFKQEVEATRAQLDALLTDSRLYQSSKNYKDLLEFVARMRNFAPFNAMLLDIQKPGIRYAATAKDWRERFGRNPKEAARPLLIMWPFGPVALVYDVLDTEGEDLPRDVEAFFAAGSIDDERLAAFRHRLSRRRAIDWIDLDAGDAKAGSIRRVKQASNDKEHHHYEMRINRNHPAPTRFVTLAHELAHLFLSHLGADKHLHIPARPAMDHSQRELEAESVAYLVSKRQGVTPASERYLANYVAKHPTVGNLDIYQVMRAAGQIESLLGIGRKAL